MDSYVEVVADSVSDMDKRITTMEVCTSASVLNELRRYGWLNVGLPYVFSESRLTPVAITATEWPKFFNYAEAAQATVSAGLKQLVADIRAARADSAPALLHDGEWHAPYVMPFELKRLGLSDALRVSVSRCHRVGAKRRIGGPALKKDKNLTRELLSRNDIAARHIAAPAGDGRFGDYIGWRPLEVYDL